MEEGTAGVRISPYMEDIMRILADRFNRLNADAQAAKQLLNLYIEQCAQALIPSAVDDYIFDYATATFVRKAEHESGPAQP